MTAVLAVGTSRTLDPAVAGSGQAPPPAEEKIAFYSNRSGNTQIYIMNPDGSGVRRLTDDPKFDGAPSWGVVRKASDVR